MTWMVPALVANLCASLLLVLVYLYLYVEDRHHYLGLWTAAWGVYALRFIFRIWDEVSPDDTLPWAATYVAAILSGLLLLWGVYAFAGRRLAPPWLVATGAAILWTLMASLAPMSPVLRVVPIFAFLAVTSIWTGIVVLRSPVPTTMGKWVVGVALILWGIHKLDYPLVVWEPRLAAPGYMLAAFLGLVVAIGTVLIYFEWTRRLLRDSEQLYSTLTAIAPVGVFQTDRVGRCLYVNPRWTGITGAGCPLPDMPAWVALVHPDDREGVARAWAAAAARGAPFAREFRFQRPDGTETWVLCQAVPQPAGDTAELTYVGTITDITERRRTEEALRESEDRLATVFREMPAVLVISTLDEGRYVDVNDAFERVFGYTRAEAVGRSSRELGIFAGIDARDRLVQDVQSKGHVRNRAVEMRNRAGKRVVGLISSTRVTVAGRPCLLSLIQDITDRTRVEEALRQSESRNRAILSALPDLVFVHDGEGRFREYSAPSPSALFLPPETFLGRRFDEVLPADVAAQADDCLRRVRETGEVQTFEYDLEVSGELRSYEARVASFGEAETMSVVRDVTRRKRDEEERRTLELKMQQTQKLESLGILAGGVAHDFNNLLAGILGNADLALMDLPPLAPARESVEQIEVAARRAADLTKQLLAYSGRGRLVVEPIDLSDLIAEMAHLLEVSISKKCEMRYSFARGLPPVQGDATQLRQVVMNLIMNASEAIGDSKGVISIVTGIIRCDEAYLSGTYLDAQLPEGEYVYIEVSDTGCGMDEEVRRRLFEPFYTTKFTGRGLGLAAVLGILRGHRGGLKLYSEPGRGTTFRILLPASADTQEDTPGAEEPESLFPRDGIVLVVDDEGAVRTLARRILERAGCTVRCAANGEEGLATFREDPQGIRAVLLDMTMPGIGGEEVLRELRRLRADVPVILSSGFDGSDVAVRTPDDTRTTFLQKPYRAQELLAALGRLLEA